jgi:hypothetical protein
VLRGELTLRYDVLEAQHSACVGFPGSEIGFRERIDQCTHGGQAAAVREPWKDRFWAPSAANGAMGTIVAYARMFPLTAVGFSCSFLSMARNMGAICAGQMVLCELLRALRHS